MNFHFILFQSTNGCLLGDFLFSFLFFLTFVLSWGIHYAVWILIANSFAVQTTCWILVIGRETVHTVFEQVTDSYIQIRIFNGCEVWIVWHHEDFESHWKNIIIDTFSCILFFRRFNISLQCVIFISYVLTRSSYDPPGIRQNISRMGKNCRKPCQVFKNILWV